MNLIYLRHTTPKTKMFMKKELRGGAAPSIYDIEAGDCCLPPAPVKRSEYLVTFLNGVSPEMLEFIARSSDYADLNRN